MEINRGLELDGTYLDNLIGRFKDAKNIVLSKGGNGSENEPGFELSDVVDGTIIGTCESSDKTILFSVYDDGVNIFSEIGTFNGSNYTKILKTQYLNFSEDNPIRAQSTFNYLGELIVAWCDGIESNSNELKILNLDNLPFDLDVNLELVTPTKIIHANLFPETYNIKIDLDSVNDGGGSLKSGIYYVCVANKTKDGTITQFSSPSNPIVIIQDGISNIYNNVQGCKSGIRTNKSFIVELSNISLNYSKLVVAVIYKENQNLFCRVTDDFEYTGTTTIVSISDYDSLSDYDITNVLINDAVYPKCEDLALNKNRLLISNLEGLLEDSIDINMIGQEVANNITVKWTHSTDDLDSTSTQNINTFKNPKYIFYNKHFRYGEVYALYLGLRSTKGGLIGCWHIPGRIATGNELDVVEDSSIESLNPGGVRLFHVIDSAQADGTLGYWQNENEYYHSLFPDFGGENVRHHKMPTLRRILEREIPDYFNDPTPEPEDYTPGLRNTYLQPGDNIEPKYNYGGFNTGISLYNGEFSNYTFSNIEGKNTKYTAVNDHVFNVNIDGSVYIKSINAYTTSFHFFIERRGIEGDFIENIKLFYITLSGANEETFTLSHSSDVYLRKGEYLLFTVRSYLRHEDDEVILNYLNCNFNLIPSHLTDAILLPGNSIMPNKDYLAFDTADDSSINGTFSSHVIEGNTLNNIKYTASSAHVVRVNVNALIRLKHESGVNGTSFNFNIRHYDSGDNLLDSPYSYYRRFVTKDGLEIYENHIIEHEEVKCLFLNTGDYLLIRGTSNVYSSEGEVDILYFDCDINEVDNILYDQTHAEAYSFEDCVISKVIWNNTPSFAHATLSEDNIKYTADSSHSTSIRLLYDIDLLTEALADSGTEIRLWVVKYDVGGNITDHIYNTTIKQSTIDELENFRKDDLIFNDIWLSTGEYVRVSIRLVQFPDQSKSSFTINNAEVTFASNFNHYVNETYHLGQFLELREQDIHGQPYEAYMDGVGELINKNTILGLELSNVVIPSSLNNIIDGWELFYAKRDIVNSTIVAQSALIPDTWYDDSGIMTNSPLRFHAFDLMLTKIDISVCNYISVEAIINRRTSTTGIYDFRNIMNNELDNTTPSIRTLIPLTTGDYSKNYVPVDNIDADNESQEGALIVYINDSSLDFVESNKIALCNLCSYKTDIYVGFQNQILVSTGLIKNNSDTTGISFNGDTFFNRYAFRLTKSIEGIDNIIRHYHRVLYLFTENSNNADLRMSGDLPEHIFYPYNELDDIRDIHFEFDNFINTVTGLGYNYDLTSLNDLVKPYINKITDRFTNLFPVRIALSLPQRSESLQFGWREFKVNNYIDLLADRGEIISINSFGKSLYIQQRYSLYLAFPKDVITGLDQSAYLKPEDIFEREPQEMIVSKNGYIGCESKFASTVCLYGYIVVDSRKRSVFFVGEKPIEISDIDCKNWFYNNMLPLSTYNPFLTNSTGVYISFDDFYKRFILVYRGITNSFSLSFLINKLTWYCFHDYVPNFYFINNKNTYYIKNYSIDNNRIFKSNVNSNRGIYLYDALIADATKYPSSVDILINPEQEVSKLIQNVYWQTVVKDGTPERVVYDDTINKLMIYNETQCTGILNINVAKMWYDTEYGVYINDTWYFNEINDNVIDNKQPILNPDLTPVTENISENLKNWYDISKFICKFIVVRLIYNNNNNRYILLKSIGSTMSKDNR